MAKVKCSILNLDTSYQRIPDSNDLKKIIKNYDPRQVRKLVLSQREDGSLWVLDGNHTRIATMEVLGNDSMLDAEIYTGLSIEEEADLFYKLNTNSKTVSFNDKLKARYTKKEPLVVAYISALDESLITYSFARSGGKGTNRAVMFVAHSAGIKAFQTYGKESFIHACNIIAFTEKQMMASGRIMQALCLIYANTTKIDDSRMINTLIKNNIEDIESKARTYGRVISSSHSNVLPYSLAIMDLYNVGLRKNKINIGEEKNG